VTSGPADAQDDVDDDVFDGRLDKKLPLLTNNYGDGVYGRVEVGKLQVLRATETRWNLLQKRKELTTYHRATRITTTT
jgi:hypothetical protein